MLESGHAENHISDVGCSGVNDDGDDEDDETGKSMAAAPIGREDDGKKEMGKKGFGRAKQVIFSPFRKAKKQILRRRIKRASSSSVNSIRRTSSSDERGFDGSVNQGCGFCFKKLLISNSKIGSPTDPNNRKFTHEMLKVLIEKNDFYSKESNPH